MNCGTGEVLGCTSHCQKNCSNYNYDISCHDVCVLGCVCIDPFIRGPDGTCIMPYECPAMTDSYVPLDTCEESEGIQCTAEEEVSCYAHCQRNCSNIDQIIVCPGEGPRGCVCKPPMIRGPGGTCIMPEQCPASLRNPQAPKLSQTACGIAQMISCKSHCQKNCSNYDKDIPCPDICVLGCMCIDPFIRASDGSCIMPYECPTTPETSDTTDTAEDTDDIQCQPDEEASNFSHCQRNCTNVGEMIVCPGEGPRGCVCKSPKIRGPDNDCIMADQCPASLRNPQILKLSQTACGIAQMISCKSHCQKNCSNYDKDIPCPDICVIGCVCIDPFIRASDGSCIMPYECPATPETPDTTDTTEEPDIECQPDEEASSFAHCQRNCTNIGQMIVCPGEGPRGCVCKSPKIRGPNGDCIMEDQCPSDLRSPQYDDEDDATDITCPPNENVSCFSHCQANCTTFDKQVPCKMICVQGCVCIPPLIRGPDGSCIMPEQCNVLKKTLLVKQCADSQECDEDDNEEDTSDDEISLKAVPGPFDNFEFCEDQNEVYKVCSSQCPDNCENYKRTRRACKLVCLPLPKCECKEGYVRGPSGNCIMPEQCPALETSDDICPEHEEFKECGTACQKTCQNYDEAIPCGKGCISGCVCKEPLIRGPDGKCIYKDECPAKLRDVVHEMCPEDEEYKECGTACQKNCRDYDKNIPCEFKCEPGCFCKDPMVRGPGGKCIRTEECPAKSNESRQPRKNVNMRFLPDLPTITCKTNEEFSFCAPMCPDDCSNYKEDRLCKRICVPGCRCIEGYVKGRDGTCIKKEECEEKKRQ